LNRTDAASPIPGHYDQALGLIIQSVQARQRHLLGMTFVMGVILSLIAI
jgi:hypothetical protein